VEYVQNLLDQVGLDGKRVRMVNASAAMGVNFARYAEEMAQQIEQLGVNPLGRNSST
jgi:coenzyme F420-reducing hydrogenase delta subunit